jgi:hypothetical protein
MSATRPKSLALNLFFGCVLLLLAALIFWEAMDAERNHKIIPGGYGDFGWMAPGQAFVLAALFFLGGLYLFIATLIRAKGLRY